jgi:hypothetical protein
MAHYARRRATNGNLARPQTVGRMELVFCEHFVWDLLVDWRVVLGWVEEARARTRPEPTGERDDARREGAISRQSRIGLWSSPVWSIYALTRSGTESNSKVNRRLQLGYAPDREAI